MSFVAVAIAAVGVGTAVYSGQQQKKAAKEQANALRESREADARDRAQAESGALVAANAEQAAAKRRRRNNALALGETGSESLGGAGVLGAPAAATTPTVRG